MKKFFHLLKAWWKGDELEFEFDIPLEIVLLFGAILLFFILRWLL